MRRLVFTLVPVVSGLAAGCWLRSLQTPEKPIQETTRLVFVDGASLKPEVLPYKSARLILASTEVRTTLERKQKGDDVLFELVSQGVSLEEEHYRILPAGFGLVGLPGESYEPPIPLVRYPFNVGESWDWSGSASLGPNLKPASAALTSGRETLNLATGVTDCVWVSVALTVDTGQGGESKRTLKFWFKPQGGIVKRDVASSSTREPRPDDSLSE